MRLWRWFLGADEAVEHRALRVRGEELGFALPRNLAETAGDQFRVLVRKRRTAVWRHPEPDERNRFGPAIELFADALDAIATVEGETWLLGERLWFGFPDPPRYVVVFLAGDGQVVAAAELNDLPRRWTMPIFPAAG